MQNYKKCRKNWKDFLIILVTVLALEGAFLVIVDPYFQYHAPVANIPVILDNAVYQTAGAARNLEYSDAIVGTSMTENFHTSWFDEEMGWNTMKLSYSGARSNDLKAIFTEIFSREESVKHIFMDINDYQLTSPAWTAYAERPEFLYGNNPLDDYRYIYNRDVISCAWERVLDALLGVGDNVDTAYTWEDEEFFGSEIVLDMFSNVREALLREKPKQESLEQKLMTCQENLDNITPFIEQNPNTEFIIFLPPYSMIYWEQALLKGELESELRIYEYAMERFLEYDNVKVYYFQDEREIITNLDNYRDACHHLPKYNRYIFECIRDDKKRVTQENLKQIMQDMYEFTREFDYTVYWQ